MPHKKKNIKKVQRWIDDNKQAIGLGDWQFEVTRHYPEKAAAEVDCVPQAQRAAIDLSDDFFSRQFTRRERTQVLVHELTHCHLERIKEFVRTQMQANGTSRDTFDALVAGVHLEVEYAVDHLAWVLLPLVDKL